MTCQRHWTRHTPVRCRASMKRSENMHNGCSDVSRCLFGLFASKNSPRSLRFSSTTRHPLYSTQIGVQRTQENQYCPYVPVLLPSSIGEATKWSNSLISLSRST